MKQTVFRVDFIAAFHAAGRGEQFTADARSMLYDHFVQYERATGEELELDVIGVCCDYSEDRPEDIAASYDITGDVVEYLNREGVYIGTTRSGSIVYRRF